MNTKYTANYIKAEMIDYLIKNGSQLVIGNELMYGTHRKVADLVSIDNEKISVFEIKSEFDTLDRLNIQIVEYEKVFDRVEIVVAKKHLSKILEIHKDSDIGVWVFDFDFGIRCIKASKLQRKKNKTEILHSMNSVFLSRKLGMIAHQFDADEVRKKLTKVSVIKLNKWFAEYLIQKYKYSYNLFLLERGEVTHVEDIPLLTFLNKIEL